MATLDLTGAVHKQRMPTSLETRTHVGRFTARYDYRYQSLAVVAYESSPGTWAVSTYPGVATLVIGDGATPGQDDQVSADYIFYGGETYTISDANLVSALSGAGYDCA